MNVFERRGFLINNEGSNNKDITICGNVTTMNLFCYSSRTRSALN